LIGQVSAERIGKEISSLLTGPDPAKGLSILAEVQLLDVVLPEVAALQGVPQPEEYHPEGDVWTHTLLMFQYSQSRSLPLGLAILLHDVGKPPTLSYADRIRFDGHTKLGSEMTRTIGRRLRLPNNVVKLAADMVAQHMRFLDVQNMRPATLKKFLRQDHFAEYLELHRLDCLASHGNLGQHDFCSETLATFLEEDLKPLPLLRGQDLLAMGYEEGPRLGQILRELETAQLEGELRTTAEAKTWVRRTYPLP
jgi:poly(A) polymerase